MVVKNNHALVTNEQIHWNQLFFEMYGLAVVLTIPKLTTSKNIDETLSVANSPAIFIPWGFGELGNGNLSFLGDRGN